VDRARIEELALKYALINAIRYSGKANEGAVISKVLGEEPELRKNAKYVMEVVRDVVARVNSMSIEEQRRILQSRWPDAMEERRTPGKKGISELPPLPNDDKYKVIVLRFAPNPDFPLHLGSARPAIINYAYRLKYGELGRAAKFILRFEDTDPRIKKPMLEAYDAIREDLRWLGIKWDEEYIQSDRIPVYYDVAKKLVMGGFAYVASEGSACTPRDWKRSRIQGVPCPNRDADPSLNMELLDRMLSGHYGEGEAVLVIKTDLRHPDPSVRDWVALRIIDTEKHPHPRVGSRYHVWPTYNFSVSVDDHMMGVTHILRAQEHSVNTIKQSYVYKHMGWDQPEAIHFGRLKLVGMVLSKSKLRSLGIRWDDPRLPTLAGLRNRGIQPEAVWEIMLQVGIKPSDATITMDNLFAENRRIIEPRANRYMAAIDPVKVIIRGLEGEAVARLPMHPSYPERGYREIRVDPVDGKLEVYISSSDAMKLGRGSVIRLMELMNIVILDKEDGVVRAEFHSPDLDEAKRIGAPIIQWVPATEAVRITIIRPRDMELIREEGLAEAYVRYVRINEIIQFMRYGFVRKINDSEFIYVHN